MEQSLEKTHLKPKINENMKKKPKVLEVAMAYTHSAYVWIVCMMPRICGSNTKIHNKNTKKQQRSKSDE